MEIFLILFGYSAPQQECLRQHGEIVWENKQINKGRQKGNRLMEGAERECMTL